MRATMESFGLWSNSEGLIQVDWRIEPPWTHIDLLGPTPTDSLDRLQISIPALEIRSTLAHWNCPGLTWTICQTWDLDSLKMAWPDSKSWNWLTLTHTKRVEFQADSKQSPNAFTVALINARKSYWTPVILRRFTSIWVSPTEIKVSPSLYERVGIQLPKFKPGWVGPSVKVIPREYNAVPAHSESVQMRASHQPKDIWVIPSELQDFHGSSQVKTFKTVLSRLSITFCDTLNTIWNPFGPLGEHSIGSKIIRSPLGPPSRALDWIRWPFSNPSKPYQTLSEVIRGPFRLPSGRQSRPKLKNAIWNDVECQTFATQYRFWYDFYRCIEQNLTNCTRVATVTCIKYRACA